MTQISTSVEQTPQVVVLQPAARTMKVASHVPVGLDTVEMDLRVQVSHIEIQITYINTTLLIQTESHLTNSEHNNDTSIIVEYLNDSTVLKTEFGG